MRTACHRLFAAISVIILASTQGVANGQALKKQSLAGTWTVTSCVGGGGDMGKLLGTQWKIEGSTLTVDSGLLKPEQPPGTPPCKIMCVLNTSKTPFQIDIIVEAVAELPKTPDAAGAPIAGMGFRRIHKGVYALSGDILRISLNCNPEIRHVVLMPDGNRRESVGGLPTVRPSRVSGRAAKASIGMVALVTLRRAKDTRKGKTSAGEP